MKAGSIAKRYAKALIDIGKKDTGRLEKIGFELESIKAVLSGGGFIKNIFVNPLYDMQFKKKLIGMLSEKMQASKETVNFLYLLIDKERMSFFPEITEAYQEYVDEIVGRVKAFVKTAFPLDKGEQESIKAGLEKWSGKKVVLDIEIDSELIGGVVVRIGDSQFDGSLKNQLRDIKDTLMKG